ncbi:MAG: hypothetical protein AAGA54_01145 [Myxococcota bacterium]
MKVWVYMGRTMSHIIRRAVFAQALLLATGLGLGACDAQDTDTEAGAAPAAGGKADDTTEGPIGALAAGTQGSGYVAGDAVHVYVVAARPGSVINARVERTDGDLDPTAFLYNGLARAQADDYEAPTHGFSNESDAIEAGWTVPNGGDVILVVGASGGSAGEFSVEVTCHEDSPFPCNEGGVDDELGYCEAVREAWLTCYESEDESDEDCNDWLGHEDTLDDENCCELWDENGLASEEFCAW